MSRSIGLSGLPRDCIIPFSGGYLTEPPPPDFAVGLVEGDNAVALYGLRSTHQGAFSLIYLDPPFFTGRVLEGEVKEGGRAAFDDRWEDLRAYLEWLRVRLSLARALLTPEGCLVVHVDPKTSHYVRVLGDMIFGPEAFASEIVWRYRRWPSKTPNFQKVHDVLLRFVRDPSRRPKFNQLFEPLAPSTQAVWKGRKQTAVVEGGKRLRSSIAEEASPGVPMGDVWEIGIIAPSSRERTGYPTQKPEALLERLLLACTDPGDLVLDPTMGSGTTLSVAARLGRRAVGIDESKTAIDVARARLVRQGIELVGQGVAIWEAKAHREDAAVG